MFYIRYDVYFNQTTMSILTKQQWIDKVIKGKGYETWPEYVKIQHKPNLIQRGEFVFINDLDVTPAFNIAYKQYTLSLLPIISNFEMSYISIVSEHFDCVNYLNVKPIFAGDSGYFDVSEIMAHLPPKTNHMWIIHVIGCHDLSDMYIWSSNYVQKLDLPQRFHILELRKRLKSDRIYGDLMCLVSSEI